MQDRARQYKTAEDHASLQSHKTVQDHKSLHKIIEDCKRPQTHNTKWDGMRRPRKTTWDSPWERYMTQDHARPQKTVQDPNCTQQCETTQDSTKSQTCKTAKDCIRTQKTTQDRKRYYKRPKKTKGDHRRPQDPTYTYIFKPIIYCVASGFWWLKYIFSPKNVQFVQLKCCLQ